MKFNSGKEMLDYIQSGKDLYSPSEQLYIFEYNDCGSIAYYYISNEQAAELRKTNEYWGASLGPGGWIIDSKEYYEENSDMYDEHDEYYPEDFCNEYYMLDDWEEADYIKED